MRSDTARLILEYEAHMKEVEHKTRMEEATMLENGVPVCIVCKKRPARFGARGMCTACFAI